MTLPSQVQPLVDALNNTGVAQEIRNDLNAMQTQPAQQALVTGLTAVCQDLVQGAFTVETTAAPFEGPLGDLFLLTTWMTGYAMANQATQACQGVSQLAVSGLSAAATNLSAAIQRYEAASDLTAQQQQDFTIALRAASAGSVNTFQADADRLLIDAGASLSPGNTGNYQLSGDGVSVTVNGNLQPLALTVAGNPGSAGLSETFQPNGSGTISADGQQISYANGLAPYVTLGSSAAQVSFLGLAGGGPLPAVSIAGNGITINQGSSTFSDQLGGSTAWISSTGDVTISAQTSGGNTATMALSSTGNDLLSVGRDQLSINATSISGSNGTFSLALGTNYGLTWNSNTGYAQLSVNGFSSALGQINPGDILKETTSPTDTVLSLTNSTGQVLNSTDISAANQSQLDTSFSYSGGQVQTTAYDYSRVGGLNYIRWSSSAGTVTDYAPTSNASGWQAQEVNNANGSGSVSGNGQTVELAGGVQPNVSVGAGNAVTVFVPNSNIVLDLTTGGIVSDVNGASFYDTFKNTQALINAQDDVQFVSGMSDGNTGTLTIAPDGTQTFQVGQDKLQFNPGTLSGITDQGNGSVAFALSSGSAITPEELVWNSSVGRLTVSVGGQISTGGWIDPGDTASVTNTSNGLDVNVANSAATPIYNDQLYTGGTHINTVYGTGPNAPWLMQQTVYDDNNNVIGIATINNDGGTTINRISNGAVVSTQNYNSQGKLTNPDPAPDKPFSAFEVNEATTLANQLIGQVLLTNNLPASTITEGAVDSLIQTVTAGTALSFSQALTNAVYSEAGSIGSLGGALLGQTIAKDLGLPTQAGSMAGGAVAQALVQKVAAYLFPDTFSTASVSSSSLFSSLSNGLAGSGGAYVGSELASLVAPTTTAGEITGALAVTGTITLLEGALSLDPVTAILELFGASTIASFLGTLVGDIADLFDYRGRPLSVAHIAFVNDKYAINGLGSDNGATTAYANSEATSTDNMVNSFLTAIGGNDSSTFTWQVGSLKSLAFSSAIVNGIPAAAQYSLSSDAAANAVETLLDNTTISGGNLMMQYAMRETVEADLTADGGHTVNGSAELTTLSSNLNAAYAYSAFAANPGAFNLALAMSTASNYATWQSEYATAQSLGLGNLTYNSTGLTLTVSSANVLQKATFYTEMIADNVVTAIAFSDTTMPTLTLPATSLQQYAQLLGAVTSPYQIAVTGASAANAAISKITGSRVAITVTGATATDAATFASQPNVVTVDVTDTPTAIENNLGGLQSVSAAGKLGAISSSGTSAMTLTRTQASTYSSVLAKITGPFNATVVADDRTNETVSAVGSGTKTVSFAGDTFGVTVNLATNVATETVSVNGRSTTYTDTLSGGFNAIIGTTGDDVLTAGGPNEVLSGDGGSDTFIGAAQGNDTFVVQAGSAVTTIQHFNPLNDKIDVPNVTYSANVKFTYVAAAGGLSGELKATANGATILDDKFTNLTQPVAYWKVASDGAGGTVFTDPPLATDGQDTAPPATIAALDPIGGQTGPTYDALSGPALLDHQLAQLVQVLATSSGDNSALDLPAASHAQGDSTWHAALAPASHRLSSFYAA